MDADTQGQRNLVRRLFIIQNPLGIGRKIMKRRIEMRKTRSQYAAEWGISYKTPWNWEHDRRSPSGNKLKKLNQLCGAPVGVNATSVETIAQVEEVSCYYLDPADLERIRQSSDPMHAFAIAWTELEARVKSLKAGRSGWSTARANSLTKCKSEHIALHDRVVMAVATATDSP
jgi:transcriptional regulator with XRE-family HTH domain